MIRDLAMYTVDIFILVQERWHTWKNSPLQWPSSSPLSLLLPSSSWLLSWLQARPVIDNGIDRHCHRVLCQHLILMQLGDIFNNFCNFVVVEKSTNMMFDEQIRSWTSCGGTPSVIVRRSTFWYASMQGRTKKIPRISLSEISWSDISWLSISRLSISFMILIITILILIYDYPLFSHSLLMCSLIRRQNNNTRAFCPPR